MHKLMRGALAGTAATLPMTWVMLKLFRDLPKDQQYPLPPRLILESLTDRTEAGLAISEKGMKDVTLLAHYGYGAATGALFPLLEKSGRNPLLLGAGYGIGIWAASYLGWIPAANILSPATRHPRKRNALMLAAHLVWGTALAGTSRLLAQAGKNSSSALHRRPAPPTSTASSQGPSSRIR